jgi:ferritin-like metal-binding protein YciE
MPANLEEQLTKYLTDAHAIEEQALPQMRAAPDLAGDPELSRAFREHLAETEEQERLVRARLEARDAAPSKLKDLVARAGAFPFVLFAKSQPDTPGKLVAHAHSYEAMELAAYEFLRRVAERAGDQETAAMATTIADQERAMRDRLAAGFDRAVEASLVAKGVSGAEVAEHVVKYLTDAHAIESQAIQLLERAPKIAGDAELARLYEEHLAETRDQQRRVAQRLEALGGSPSKLKDGAMRLGALNWGAFFQAQPDTPAKLAGFAFAFEHLEIAAYELLRRVAERAGDTGTADLANAIAAEERAAADRIAGAFDRAVEASLEAQGVAA